MNLHPNLQAKLQWIIAKSEGYHDGYDGRFPKLDTVEFICHAQYMKGYRAGQDDRYWLAQDEFGLTARDYDLAGVSDESDHHDPMPHTDDYLDASECPEFGF